MHLKSGLVTCSQQSAAQLYCDGYYYRARGKPKTDSGDFQWRCIRTELKCPAKCMTHGNNIGSRYDVHSEEASHVHQQDFVNISKLEKRRQIKERVLHTNNFTEAWHNSFSGMLNSHPSIYTLIDAMRSEQKKQKTTWSCWRLVSFTAESRNTLLWMNELITSWVNMAVLRHMMMCLIIFLLLFTKFLSSYLKLTILINIWLKWIWLKWIWLKWFKIKYSC